MSEFLVELASGREVVYHTPLALREAMRSGEITSEARIYHHAASRWISITEHPEYRKFMAERRPPDWLEPIPLEPAGPLEPEEPPSPPVEILPPAGGGARTLLARAGEVIKAFFAWLNPPPPEEPIEAPKAAEPRRERPRSRRPPTAVPPAPPPPTPEPPPPTPSSPPTPSHERKRWTFY